MKIALKLSAGLMLLAVSPVLAQLPGTSLGNTLAVVGSDQVALVNPTNYQLARVVEGVHLQDGPTEISTDAHWALTVIQAQDSLRISDLEGRDPTRLVHLPWAPAPVAAFTSPDLQTAWVVSAGLKAVIECDAATWTPKRRLPLEGPTPIRALHQGSRMLIQSRSSIAEIDLTSMKLLRTETLLGTIEQLDWSQPDGHEAICVERAPGRQVWEFARTAAGFLGEFSPATTGVLRLWPGSIGVVIGGHSGVVWASKLPVGGQTWTRKFPEPVADLQCSRDGKSLFLTQTGSNAVVVADLQSGKEVARIVIPFAPQRLAWPGSTIGQTHR
jgi:hypothetical protein